MEEGGSLMDLSSASASGASPSCSVRNLVLSVCDLKQVGDVPSSRVSSQIATIGTRLYLHGGADEKQAFADLYQMQIEKSSWRELTVGGFSKPSGRYGHSVDVWEDCLVMFGGLAVVDADSITLDDSIRNNFPAPPFMGTHARAWAHMGKPSSQVFTLQTDSLVWTECETTGGPQPRAYHASTIAKGHLLIHGGASDSLLETASNDLHILALEGFKWIPVQQGGQLPTPRFGHKMVYCEKRDCVYLFGGADDDGALFSLAMGNLGEPINGPVVLTWTRLEISNTPPLARSFHTVNLIGDRVFVFAGQTLSDISDLYVYDINKNVWSRPLYDGQINLKAHASAVLHDKLIIFGGARERSDMGTEEAGRTEKDGDKSRMLWVGGSNKSQRISKKLFFINVLEIKEGGGEGDFKFKMVVVGDTGVGKSCLLTRFVTDQYSEFHVSTIGVDFKSVVTMIKGKLVTIQLWDTAGQERFGGMTGNYYRNADGFVLVYDSTRRESFNHVETWIRQIQEHHECGPNTIKLLVGNKSDLRDSLEVTQEEALALADKIGAIHVAASAKTASNVDAAFLSAATKLVEMRRRAAQTRNTVQSISGGAAPQRINLGSGGAAQARAAGCGGCSNGGGNNSRMSATMFNEEARRLTGAGR